MGKFIFFLFSFLMFSCEQVQEKSVVVATPIQNNNKQVFFPQHFSKDTLYLNVMIDDCGEWGGPEEKFKIYTDSIGHHELDYKRYRFNCDSIKSFYDNKQKPLEYKKSMVLKETHLKAVSAFLVNLMQAKTAEYVDSNAGSVYYLSANDSTLLRIHSTDDKIEKDFYKFKRDLGFPVNRKKKDVVPVVF